jgi:hypothetical protein
MRLVILSAALAAATAAVVAAPAVAQPLQHFTRDGEQYSYKVARQANGVILVRGTVDSTGDDFALRVRGNEVEGQLGMSDVAFRISPETAARLTDEVAQAATPAVLASN